MVALIAASLPGLAALGALLFTWMQVGQANKELRISESGQITSRFNNAVRNLGSQFLDVRLGGIYALQRIMQDSAFDHPTVVSVLAAFVQQHAGSSAKSLKEPMAYGIRAYKPKAESADNYTPKADVLAAISVLARRRPERDNGTIVDLSFSDLRSISFTGKGPINFPEVDLSTADLRWATLNRADLSRASLIYANLNDAFLEAANLRAADLKGTKLEVTSLKGADLRGADMTCASGVPSDTGQIEPTDCVDLRYALLDDADLRNAKMGHADLRQATLVGADLRHADLNHADLRHADLRHADFRGAKLTNVKLQDAKRTGARGLPPEG
ncbi:pentapeptide repeat-containing protein [Streptomyces sp. NPDC021080]|uniref:pentapeptide repeat-containing protein n=1 Tax=Streptomyces sp. NPDC021080 TaxID=3365110 RepID=UPI0037B6FBB5